MSTLISNPTTRPRGTRLNHYPLGLHGPYVASPWAAARLGQRVFASKDEYRRYVLADFDAAGHHHPTAVAERIAAHEARVALENAARYRKAVWDGVDPAASTSAEPRVEIRKRPARATLTDGTGQGVRRCIRTEEEEEMLIADIMEFMYGGPGPEPMAAAYVEYPVEETFDSSTVLSMDRAHTPSAHIEVSFKIEQSPSVQVREEFEEDVLPPWAFDEVPARATDMYAPTPNEPISVKLEDSPSVYVWPEPEEGFVPTERQVVVKIEPSPSVLVREEPDEEVPLTWPIAEVAAPVIDLRSPTPGAPIVVKLEDSPSVYVWPEPEEGHEPAAPLVVVKIEPLSPSVQVREEPEEEVLLSWSTDQVAPAPATPARVLRAPMPRTPAVVKIESSPSVEAIIPPAPRKRGVVPEAPRKRASKHSAVKLEPLPSLEAIIPPALRKRASKRSTKRTTVKLEPSPSVQVRVEPEEEVLPPAPAKKTRTRRARQPIVVNLESSPSVHIRQEEEDGVIPPAPIEIVSTPPRRCRRRSLRRMDVDAEDVEMPFTRSAAAVSVDLSEPMEQDEGTPGPRVKEEEREDDGEALLVSTAPTSGMSSSDSRVQVRLESPSIILEFSEPAVKLEPIEPSIKREVDEPSLSSKVREPAAKRKAKRTHKPTVHREAPEPTIKDEVEEPFIKTEEPEPYVEYELPGSIFWTRLPEPSARIDPYESSTELALVALKATPSITDLDQMMQALTLASKETPLAAEEAPCDVEALAVILYACPQPYLEDTMHTEVDLVYEDSTCLSGSDSCASFYTASESFSEDLHSLSPSPTTESLYLLATPSLVNDDGTDSWSLPASPTSTGLLTPPGNDCQAACIAPSPEFASNVAATLAPALSALPSFYPCFDSIIDLYLYDDESVDVVVLEQACSEPAPLHCISSEMNGDLMTTATSSSQENVASLFKRGDDALSGLGLNMFIEEDDDVCPLPGHLDLRCTSQPLPIGQPVGLWGWLKRVTFLALGKGTLEQLEL